MQREGNIGLADTTSLSKAIASILQKVYLDRPVSTRTLLESIRPYCTCKCADIIDLFLVSPRKLNHLLARDRARVLGILDNGAFELLDAAVENAYAVTQNSEQSSSLEEATMRGLRRLARHYAEIVQPEVDRLLLGLPSPN